MASVGYAPLARVASSAHVLTAADAWDILQRLPPDLAQHVFTLMPTLTRRQMRSSCRALYTLFNNTVTCVSVPPRPDPYFGDCCRRWASDVPEPQPVGLLMRMLPFRLLLIQSTVEANCAVYARLKRILRLRCGQLDKLVRVASLIAEHGADMAFWALVSSSTFNRLGGGFLKRLIARADSAGIRAWPCGRARPQLQHLALQAADYDTAVPASVAYGQMLRTCAKFPALRRLRIDYALPPLPCEARPSASAAPHASLTQLCWGCIALSPARPLLLPVAELGRLTCLELVHCDVGPHADAVFAALLQLSSLERLRLVDPQLIMSDANQHHLIGGRLGRLTALPALRKLELGLYPTSDVPAAFHGLGQLQRLTALQVVASHRCASLQREVGQHAHHLSELQSLCALSLAAHVSGNTLRVLVLPQLTRLRCASLRPGDADVAISSTLQDMTFDGNLLPFEPLDTGMVGGMGLGRLRMGERPASQLTRLVTTGTGTALDMCDLRALVLHTGMRALCVTFWSPGVLSDAHIVTLLGSLTRLTELRLGSYSLASVTDTGMQVLGRVSELVSVSLCNNVRLTEAGLMPLVHLPKLRDLALSGNMPGVTDGFVAALLAAAASSLRSLSMSVFPSLSVEGCRAALVTHGARLPHLCDFVVHPPGGNAVHLVGTAEHGREASD